MKGGVFCFFGFHFLCVASALQAQIIVGHRGASFDAPENTCSSFRLAWEQGADAVESDYYLTSDNQIACIHDDTTERTAGKSLSVPRSTLAELQELDVGSWKDPRFAGERIPTLCDVLALVPKGKCVFIEIKCGPEIVPALQQTLIESRLSPSQTVIISFNKGVIRAVKQVMPERQAYWLVDFVQDKKSGAWSPTVDQLVAEAKDIGADGLDLDGNTDIVNENLVARCSQAGLSVHVWTIDDPGVAAHFQRLGVASITTNRPRVLRERLCRSPAPLGDVSRALPANGSSTDSRVGVPPGPAEVR